MKAMNFKDRWVLVTGASAGLGRAIAERLAVDHHANLVVTARRADRLEALKKELEAKAGVSVLPITADMTKLATVDALFDRATTEVPLYAAVLNAGVTHFGHYHELAWEDFEALLHTNVTSVVRMTTRLIPYLEKRDEGGGVLIVSSMAGMYPVPYQTVYSATKAFLVHFGRGLYHELRGKNVSITVYAPNGIATEMTEGERFESLRSWLAPVDEAARDAIVAFERRGYLYVPGALNRIGDALMRVLPRRMVSDLLASEYKKSLARSDRSRERSS
jgi:short-subunit dehydrogenase